MIFRHCLSNESYAWMLPLHTNFVVVTALSPALRQSYCFPIYCLIVTHFSPQNDDICSFSFPASSPSFWLFYSSPLLHPIGWGVANGFDYRPPLRIIRDDDTFAFWVDTLRQSLFFSSSPEDDKFIPRQVFVGQQTLDAAHHHFCVGMKVEAIDPENPHEIAPATVVKVVGEIMFFVQMDAVDGNKSLLNNISYLIGMWKRSIFRPLP